jgi:hypothetical protein
MMPSQDQGNFATGCGKIGFSGQAAPAAGGEIAVRFGIARSTLCRTVNMPVA